MAKWKRLAERLFPQSTPAGPAGHGQKEGQQAGQLASNSQGGGRRRGGGGSNCGSRGAARGGGGAGGPFRGISRRVNPRPAAVGPPAKVNKPFYIADLPNNKTVKRGRLFHPFGLLVSFGSARDLLPCLDQLEDDNIIAQLWIRSRTENGN
jgi:hypothetical protein